jgi:FkbM family methyltransferase
MNLLDFLRLIKDSYFRNKQQQEFDAKLFEFYSGLLNKGSKCYDIGASYGYRTEAFLKVGASVVAVEPQKKIAKYLKKKFGNEIQLVQKAVGAKVEKRIMYLSPHSVLSSLSSEWITEVKKNNRFNNLDWEEQEEVEVTTLDKLIIDYGKPDFCKIDVEGYELEVIKGLSQPISLISFEFTIPEFTERAINCIRHLEKLGNIKCNLSKGETLILNFSEWLDPHSFIEKFKTISKSGIKDGDIYIKYLIH